MELVKRTSLETADNISDVLNWKLKQLEDKQLPIESGLADYIAFGVENILNDIEQLNNYKSQIDLEIKNKNIQLEKAKEEIAQWLENQGIDKLNGVNCSSITISKAIEATETKQVKQTLIYDFNSQEYTDLEDFLIKNGYAHYLKKEVTKITPAKPSMIKINKKRK